MITHIGEKTNIGKKEPTNDDFNMLQIIFVSHAMSSDQRTVKNPSPLTDLFTRIQFEHLRSKQHKRLIGLKYTFIYLLGTASILYLLECHVRVYNRWAGPFPIDLNQWTMSLDDHFGFSRNYVQVELGENQIEQVERILNASSDDLSGGKLPYRLIRIKDNLYVKLPTIDDYYYHSQLPYHFQSFSERASSCILQQFSGSLKEYTPWIDKSMFTKAIEEIYPQNPIEFNMKIITKCGILLGQLYRSRNELLYTINSKEPIKFEESDLILDVFPLSYSYMIFLPGILLFSWLFIKASIDLFIYVFHEIHRPPLLIHLSVKNHLNSLQVNCLEKLDDLLSRTANENNHHNRLFLLRDQYLLILYLDWNEHNPSTLHRFYEQDPLIVIPVEQIVCIEKNEILSKHGDQHTWHSLPIIHSISTKHTVQWLHQKLMHISTVYQQWYILLLLSELRYVYIFVFCSSYADLELKQNRPSPEWQKQKKLRRQQQREEGRLRRQREKELKRRLQIFIAEEEEQQRIVYEHNRQTILSGVIPASPHFIAQFRLTSSEQINHDLSDTLCAVCHGEIEYGESYAQWPCQAKHDFHYDCMLMVLRAHHTCPLCRHPVQRSDFILRL